MKTQLLIIAIAPIFLLSCSKNTSPTSLSSETSQISRVYISGNTVWDSSSSRISSLQYNDTLCVPYTRMDARLIVIEVDKNNINIPLSDSVVWYTGNTSFLYLSKTQNKSTFLVNSDSLSVPQTTSVVVPVYCRVGSSISDTMYVQILYNATRFNCHTLEFSSVLTLSNISITQWGREISVSDSAGRVVQVLRFDGRQFSEDLNNNLAQFSVNNSILSDYSYESDILTTFTVSLKGNYTRISNNQTGTWSLK